MSICWVNQEVDSAGDFASPRLELGDGRVTGYAPGDFVKMQGLQGEGYELDPG